LSEILVWDTEDWSPLESISEEGNQRFLAIDDAGELLATSGFGLVTLRDLDTGAELQSITLPDWYLAEVAFIDSDHLIIQPFYDFGPALVLSLDPEELVAIARSRVGRDFTQTECETYGLDCSGLEEAPQG
jgi:hypothetical protein